MSEAFEIIRLQTRAFRARHLASGQVFELRGKQGVHYWAAHRVNIKDGTVNKHIFLDDWQSKKKLLENLDKKIMQEIEKTVKLAEIEKQKLVEARKRAEQKAAMRGSTRFRPEEYAKLQRKAVNKYQTTLLAPASGEKFTLFNNGKDGYRIEFFEGGKQPICTGMDTENDAILELYYYLDPGADWEKYKAECFRKR